jgi:tRNA (cmo5U34)-methyltransferase
MWRSFWKNQGDNMTVQQTSLERQFSGQIGAEYEMLRLICPASVDMSRRVGETLANRVNNAEQTPQILELGCGTGITTLSVLAQNPGIQLHSVDNEPTMLNQAREHLRAWLDKGVVTFSEIDVLGALLAQESASLSAIVSAYTLHNFLQDYRAQVYPEIFRVLKPGGVFINGDRYALDDTLGHTKLIQQEIQSYFDVLIKMNRADLLEKWIVHLFSDESPDHVMRLQLSLDALGAAGFTSVEQGFHDGVNRLLIAHKPLV